MVEEISGIKADRQANERETIMGAAKDEENIKVKIDYEGILMKELTLWKKRLTVSEENKRLMKREKNDGVADEE